jgi:S1-C subfamily serine protease
VSVRRLALSLVLVLVGVAVVAAAPDPPRLATTLAEAESAQVQLITIRRSDGVAVARGSAFFVDAEGRLLTCAHVLDHMPKDDIHRLRLSDGRERRFAVLKVDREVDLAVLLADPPPYYLALDAPTLPEIGQVVRLGGRAARPAEASTPALFRAATVVALDERWATGARRTVGSRRRIVSIKVDQVADPGQSGGPLLAVGSLAVVGVLRSNLETATGGLGGTRVAGFGAAIPLVYVRPLLEPVD